MSDVTQPPPPPSADDPTEPEKTDKQPNGCLLIIAVVVVFGLLAWGCTELFGSDDSGSDDSSGSASSSANLACRHWRNVARDGGDGMLTTGEIRSKIQEVWDDAQYADEPYIVSSGRQLLAAITSGSNAEFSSASSAFTAACSRAGAS